MCIFINAALCEYKINYADRLLHKCQTTQKPNKSREYKVNLLRPMQVEISILFTPISFIPCFAREFMPAYLS